MISKFLGREILFHLSSFRLQQPTNLNITPSAFLELVVRSMKVFLLLVLRLFFTDHDDDANLLSKLYRVE